MDKIGKIIEARVTDQNDTHYFVQNAGETFAIEKATLDEELDLDEIVEGLVYKDKFDKLVMQLDLPNIRPGIYGWGTVLNSKYDLGIFVDVGLINKDVVVSLDDLPEESSLWPKIGDRLYLTYSIDNRARFWGHVADDETISELFIKAHERLMNQNLNATVYRLRSEGVAAISEEGFDIFIHESELNEPARVGQALTVRVINVHSDGRLNASTKQRAYEAMDDDAEMIYAMLSKSPQQYLPFHDKSEPEAIRNQFGLSKAQFKRSVGRLMKEKRIRQEKNDGIYIIK